MALLVISYNVHGDRKPLTLASMELIAPGDLSKPDEHPLVLELQRAYEAHYARHGYKLRLPSVRLWVADGEAADMRIEAASAAWHGYGLAGVTLRALGGMQDYGQLLYPEIVVTVATYVQVHGDDAQRLVWKCRPGSDVDQDASILAELLYAALQVQYLNSALPVKPLITPMRSKDGVNFVRILVDADNLSESLAVVSRVLTKVACMVRPEDSR